MSKVLLGGGSTSSSGQSTPDSKRTIFSELLESYASTRRSPSDSRTSRRGNGTGKPRVVGMVVVDLLCLHYERPILSHPFNVICLIQIHVVNLS